MSGRHGRSSSGCGALLLNLFTMLVILATLFAGGVILALYVDPTLPFNPFPPPQTATPVPSLTPTFTAPPATREVPTATPAPSATPTPTPQPSPTPVVVLPTPTPFPYVVQPGTPTYTQNFLNEAGCQWMGVAGQVLGPDNEPVLDVWVRLGGSLEGNDFDLTALPGSAPGYGPGGYEFQLSDHPIASQDQVWVQLVDPLGSPLSEQVFLRTSDLCEENLILVNWVPRP